MDKKRSLLFTITVLSTLAFIIILIYPFGRSEAQRTKSSMSAGKEVNAEKGLKDNRYFFYFINASISNFGTDEEKKLFRQAIQRDIIAQQLFMKFLFGDSYTEVRASQKILIDLYRATIERDIRDGKQLLSDISPVVIKTQKQSSRHYLQLGYRDIESARIDMVMADNFHAPLYSMRLYHYVKAIKEAKHGKQYAIYAYLEARIPESEKKPFAINSFYDLKDSVIIYFPVKERSHYITIHYDNNFMSKVKPSLYDVTWDNPSLDEISEYKDYLKKQ